MERKEPTLSGIVPERDDDHPRQDPQSAGAGRSRSSPSAPEPPPSGGGSGWVAGLALLLAFAGLGGGGYLAWQLTESNKALVAAQNRITDLEARLDLNSDQSSETVDEIRDKLEWADSEIRKLWGVSHDTNRKKITANEDALAALKKQVGAVEKDAASARASAASIKRELEGRLQALSTQLSSATKAVETLRSSADQLQSLSLDVQRLTQQMPGLRDLASRVKTNEEAIAAIDAYRRNLNRDILQLRQQLGTSASSP
ncbi:hypothetical protein [Gilvimarinus algae]|uniref:Chromosome partition protein Smc n=1 Tax=Gilvimarinus algae TaxID=3058037 RepID=A0ABT8TCP1_9GAMM|nr:hypothetical protein [Gilvimarinus sp. SDUM040014]MDO3381869.1 hypothetical protein [Gilvimarinus sp. SDUM040014]